MPETSLVILFYYYYFFIFSDISLIKNILKCCVVSLRSLYLFCIRLVRTTGQNKLNDRRSNIVANYKIVYNVQNRTRNRCIQTAVQKYLLFLNISS